MKSLLINYPDLNPTSPSQQVINPQIYRPAKIITVETYFLDKITEREKLGKKMQRLATISNAVGTGLIATVVITGGFPIPAFVSGWALPADIAFSGMSMLLLLENSASRKSRQKINK